MGKCLELRLFSAWVNKGWGSRSVQGVLLQIGTLIIHNQTYQVSSAVEAAGSEKADQESRSSCISIMVEQPEFSFLPWWSFLLSSDRKGVRSKHIWISSCPANHWSSESSPCFWNSASKIGAFPWCRLVLCVSVATLLRAPWSGFIVKNSFDFPFAHSHSHLDKTMREALVGSLSAIVKTIFCSSLEIHF